MQVQKEYLASKKSFAGIKGIFTEKPKTQSLRHYVKLENTLKLSIAFVMALILK